MQALHTSFVAYCIRFIFNNNEHVHVRVCVLDGRWSCQRHWATAPSLGAGSSEGSPQRSILIPLRLRALRTAPLTQAMVGVPMQQTLLRPTPALRPRGQPPSPTHRCLMVPQPPTQVAAVKAPIKVDMTRLHLQATPALLLRRVVLYLVPLYPTMHQGVVWRPVWTRQHPQTARQRIHAPVIGVAVARRVVQVQVQVVLQASPSPPRHPAAPPDVLCTYVGRCYETFPLRQPGALVCKHQRQTIMSVSV
jgi:hypothetical protein